MKGAAEHEAGFDADALASHRAAVKRVIAAMREPEQGALPLGAMADIAHLSPYHFARTFRRIIGVPPGEFMAALRLERAKRLLLTTDLSVGEVCFEVGYGSLGTFTTRFTRLVGLSPGRIRRLPEALHETLGGAGEADRPYSLAAPAGVAFRVCGPDLAGTRIFVGLFPGVIPQRRPVACTVLPGAPGVYGLARCPTVTTTSWPPPCPAPKIP